MGSPGPSIPGFDISALLGRGGMGEVWKARQKGIDRWVALKILHPHFSTDEEYVRRFQRETRTVGKLAHENIVRAYDCGQADGRHYLVMEFIQGEPLDRVLARRRTLADREALGIVRAVARGLEYAWGHQVIHRDIKPQNILITPEGVPKVCDLGLSRDLGEATKLTQTGAIACTPAYASPEQAEGASRIDTRSDIYSLGVVLYQLVTGTLPFETASAAALLVKHLNEKPEPPVSRNPAVTAGTNKLILDMLEKPPDRRPPGMGSVVSRIDGLLAGKGEAPEPATKSSVRRHRRTAGTPSSALPVLAIGGGIAAALIVVIALASGGSPPPRKSAPVASRPPPAPPPEAVPAPKPPPKPAVEERPAEPEKVPARGPDLERVRAELEAQVRGAVGREEFRKAMALWQDAPKAFPDADARVAEIRKAAQDLYPSVVRQAAEANRRGDAAAVDALRKRLAAWQMPEVTKDFEQAIALPAAAVPPPPPPPAPPPPVPVPPSAPSRPKPPAAADARPLRDRLRSIMKADYEKKTPEGVRALAAKLLESARKSEEDPVMRHVFLAEARDNAVRVADAKVALTAVERIVAEYEVDAKREWSDVLRALPGGARDPATAATLVADLQERGRGAVAADDYELAAEIQKAAEAAAPKAGDPALVSSLMQSSNEIRRARTAWRTAAPHFEKLKSDPTDAEANLEAGKFLCFVKGDWGRGGGHLERGPDKALREAAERERTAAGDPDKTAAAGDAWIKAPAAREHALGLYRAAWPKLAAERREALREPLLRASALEGAVLNSPPAAWYIGVGSRPELYRLDRGRARSGRASLRVEPGGAEGWMSQGPFDTAEGREYEFAGWVLTDRTEPWKLCAVYFYTEKPPQGRIITGFHLEAPADQPWWTPLRARFKAPAGAKFLQVMVVQGLPKGTAWVDDLSLRALDPDKEHVVNGVFER